MAETLDQKRERYGISAPSIQLFWQTFTTKEEGQTEDLEHAASRFC